MHSYATCVCETSSHKRPAVEITCDTQFLAVRRALVVQKCKYMCLLLFKPDINEEDAGHQEESQT